MSIKRGSGHAAGQAVFTRTVAEAVRKGKIAARSDPSVVVPPEDVSSVIARSMFGPRPAIPLVALIEDADHLLASRMFDARTTPPPPTAVATVHTLTFGTHLQATDSSFDTTADKTIATDATDANTASTMVARDANKHFSVTGIVLPSGPGSTGHTANTLDCYVEGTYTTSIALGGGTATLSGSFNTLQYTIVGRRAHVQGKLLISSVSSPSGAVNIALPFGSTAGSGGSGAAAASVLVTAADATWTGPAMAQVPASSSFLALYEFAAGFVTDPGGKLKANTVIILSATFEI